MASAPGLVTQLLLAWTSGDRAALVHEAYLKLIDRQRAHWQNRTQFLGVAAQAMRRILVDHTRTHAAVKRGGGVRPVTLLDAAGALPTRGIDVLALDEALARLTALYPEQGRLVELRYFGGLTIEETAEVMGLSPATVKRQWAVARAWLLANLDHEAKS